jgi:hypothetical protein
MGELYKKYDSKANRKSPFRTGLYIFTYTQILKIEFNALCGIVRSTWE